MEEKDNKKNEEGERSGEPKEVNEKLSIEELKKELEELKKQKDEFLAGWQRERADFINYKKEEMERIGQLINYAKEELILEILPIMDNFDQAEKNLQQNLGKDENPEGKPSASYGASVKGLLQIRIQFQDFLKRLGVEEIKSVGEKFDPHFHEVVGELETSNQKPGTILAEVQKGYTSNGRLLRPAKVKVAK
ncbi:MAG: nucleotide exchange factor GrpE [Candidatus Pacebacteria bacterium]|nr:nucleotide exchange factor GrpE [Candidatus Paceibacterota bacterium]